MQDPGQARQFGYEVSPRPACETSGAQDYAHRLDGGVAPVRGQRDRARTVLPVVVAAAVGAVAAWSAVPPHLRAGLFMPPVIAVGVLLVHSAFHTALDTAFRTAARQQQVLREQRGRSGRAASSRPPPRTSSPPSGARNSWSRNGTPSRPGSAASICSHRSAPPHAPASGRCR
ncbi:hypothetical protein [Streptomyces sp. SID3343]|uniref:hypothetical protein n=1 Tax=Streptomyces sp. SID3343 TaxID=2690260 RepID=UPI00136887E2|nr:hypothetical protein [Streptomyces sp. SID3343]MYV97526.1 hypothetical protein [Streptomyces sp. SID3343]